MTRNRNKKAQRARASVSTLPSRPANVPPNTQHDLERILGHIFDDPAILQEALQAAGNGVTQIGDRKIEDGNKRLAMLGDSILQVVLLRDWFAEGESRREGNHILCTIASNRNLDKCGREAGLQKFINKHRCFDKGKVPRRTMSATVEALIGAVFVDSGESLNAVKVAMKGLGIP